MSDGVFREFTAGELANELDESPDEVVEIEVQDRDGNVLVKDLVWLQVTHGYDMDRSGTYRWTRIVAKVEPR